MGRMTTHEEATLQAQVEAPVGMLLCKDCKWHASSDPIVIALGRDCVSPGNGVDPVTGKVKTSGCRFRNGDGQCDDWEEREEASGESGRRRPSLSWLVFFLVLFQVAVTVVFAALVIAYGGS